MDRKKLLKRIRAGVRLDTPPPKRETPKNVYTRKTKHKRPHGGSFVFGSRAHDGVYTPRRVSAEGAIRPEILDRGPGGGKCLTWKRAWPCLENQDRNCR